jgi:cytochrome c oxidase subunit II
MTALARMVIASAPGFLCAGCAPGWQSALDPHGVQAAHLDRLMTLIMVACAAIWLLVVATLAWAVLRRRPSRSQPLTVNERSQRRMTVAVACSVAATAVIIAIFTLASFLVTRLLAEPTEADLTIKVRGYQWWWDVTYLDDGKSPLFVTANEIHIPVGRPVRLELSAADVIHSFWVPSLAGKQDLIPGRDNAMTLTATRAGIYRGQCAEFCGMQHARMAMIVVAQPPSEFDAWQQAQLSDGVSPTSDEQRAGRDIFMSKACSACHSVRGTTAVGKNGPDLTHIGSRRSIAAGVLDNTRGSLAAWIADPQTIKPGNNMPMVPLSGDDLNAVSAYMTSLK